MKGTARSIGFAGAGQGCANGVPAPENAAPNWAEGDAVGVAFLGYGTGIAAFADSPEYSAFTARYPLFAGLDPDTQWVETDGEQIFAVWPRYANSSLFLYFQIIEVFSNIFRKIIFNNNCFFLSQ